MGAIQPTRIGGYLEFIARDRRQDQDSKVGAGDTSSTETILEENIRLEMDGYAYHPNFLEFTLGGLFGLTQEDFEEEFGGRTQTSGDDGDVLEFDFLGHFLQKKKYPGTVYARRYRSLEPRAFQPSLEVTTTNYGLFWQYVSDKTPTSLEFSHSDVELNPLDDREEDGRQRNTRLRFETAYQFNDHNVLSLLYTHESVEEQPYELDYDSDELTLAHRWHFGEGYRHRLESELNYFDQRGSFEVERARWRETLWLKHTEDLRSWYRLELLDRTQGNLAGVPPIEEQSYLLSGTVEHQLYDSLISQLYAFGQVQEFDSGLDIDRLGLEANLDYRKRNRWGMLRGHYRFRAEREDRSGGDLEAEVLDEQGTFNDPEPVVLRNANVITSTIFITALDRLTFFQPTRDYQITLVGDRTEIRRVATGRIADGQTVLIDYVYQVGGSFDLDTINHEIMVREDFDFGLSPYYRFRWQDQRLSPRDATGVVPDDIQAHIVGTEYERGPLRLKAEYEDHDSTVSPFEAIRLSASYTRRFDFGATGTLRARWTDMDQKPPNDRDTQFLTLEGRYRHTVTPSLTVEAAVLYRDEDDSVDGDDQGVDADLSLEWLVRETEVRVTYEYGQFEDDFAEDRTSALFVQVRRRF